MRRFSMKRMKAEKGRKELLKECRKLSNEELKKLQKTLLDSYKDICTVCDKYELTAYLCGGSALGAIRHKGFIPWDDDLDVAMTREDYETFRRIFKKELGDQYILSAPNCGGKAKARFPKIIRKGTVYREAGAMKEEGLDGVFIDLFIIDSVPDFYPVHLLKGTAANALELIGSCAYDRKYLKGDAKEFAESSGKLVCTVRNVLGTAFSFLPPEKWFDLTDAVVRDSSPSRMRGLLTGSEHYFGEVFFSSMYSPPRLVDFEDMKAPVFHKVEEYLTNLYGDYMWIPPENERMTHYVEELKL